MKIHIKLLRIRTVVLVPFVVEVFGCLPMSLAHEVIFTLTSKAQSLGSARVIAVPGLCSTSWSQHRR